MSQYYISFTFNQQVFNYSLVANNSKESHYYLRLCFMQVLRDHELVLSCTRNLVLVFSIVILFTAQDVSGESILSQSCQFSEKKKLDDKIKSFLHREVLSKKRQFPQFVSQFIVTDFYIYPSRYKSSKMEHILVFDFFLSFYRLMLHMSMH